VFVHILFLSSWFPYPPDNGSKVRVYHLLRALGSRYHLSLLSLAFQTADPDHAAVLREFCDEVQAVYRSPFEVGTLLNATRFLSLSPVVTWPIPDMKRAVESALARTPCDVIIASTEAMACYALTAPAHSARVLEEHNSLTRQMRERYLQCPAGLRRLQCWASWQKTRRYEARLLRQFDLCTMVSELDRSVSLNELPGYQGPMEVIPNGVDCEHNRPYSHEPVPGRLVYSGALTYQANYDAMCYFLAEIYPLIRQRAPDATLTITGSTAGVNLGRFGRDASVQFTGQVPDVRPAVGGAKVCVVPLRQGGGTRLKILEAMALGTPVVSTRKGAEGLEVIDGQHLLLANHPADFADCTVRLLREPGLRASLAANARRLVEQRYDWAQIGQRFVMLVEHAAERHARQAAG
jgi:polysaccharide biosynthesis protein PslH